MYTQARPPPCARIPRCIPRPDPLPACVYLGVYPRPTPSLRAYTQVYIQARPAPCARIPSCTPTPAPLHPLRAYTQVYTQARPPPTPAGVYPGIYPGPPPSLRAYTQVRPPPTPAGIYPGIYPGPSSDWSLGAPSAGGGVFGVPGAGGGGAEEGCLRGFRGPLEEPAGQGHPQGQRRERA
eukprot:352701-Prorocentrum_minimum.AAC.2